MNDSLQRSQRHAHASAGFTLVEMLVVLTIIGLIMGLIGPRVLGYLSESKVKTAKLQIESFSSALDLFYIDTGRYPTSSEGLESLAVRKVVRRLVAAGLVGALAIGGGWLYEGMKLHSAQHRLAAEQAQTAPLQALTPHGAARRRAA